MRRASSPHRPAPRDQRNHRGRNPSQQPGPRHARPDLGTDFAAPEGDVEQEIAEVVQDLLGLEQSAATTTSSSWASIRSSPHRLMLRLTEKLEVEFTVRTILESLTVAALGKYVAAMRWAAS